MKLIIVKKVAIAFGARGFQKTSLTRNCFKITKLRFERCTAIGLSTTPHFVEERMAESPEKLSFSHNCG
jgi:hypothetical protein